MIASALILPRTRKIQTKVVEKIKTHNLWSITPPPPFENRAVYEIMWKNMVETGHR